MSGFQNAENFYLQLNRHELISIDVKGQNVIHFFHTSIRIIDIFECEH
jgi:hypothetical protein